MDRARVSVRWGGRERGGVPGECDREAIYAVTWVDEAVGDLLGRPLGLFGVAIEQRLGAAEHGDDALAGGQTSPRPINYAPSIRTNVREFNAQLTGCVGGNQEN